MSNPSGPDQPNEPDTGGQGEQHQPETPAGPESDPVTEVLFPADAARTETAPDQAERRFTAPSGFDAGSTQKIDSPPEPMTEVFSFGAPTDPMPHQKSASPQMIPPRGDAPQLPHRRRSWGWVIAVVLVIAALAALAILGTVLLTRGKTASVSQEDLVRSTIQNFDTAIQRGDLATLRSITCGTTRDSYVNYDERAWSETHARVAAAKRYPVVASIDQVIVNGDHAEANVTTFMAYAPQTRSTRSFDLQFRDDQWKICQAPAS
jgi:hypothetical protein